MSDRVYARLQSVLHDSSTFIFISYSEFSILSPRITSPKFSAFDTISLGRQNGSEYHSYGSWVLVEVSLFTYAI